MFVCEFFINDQFLIIIGEALGVTERYRSAQICREQPREAQSSTDGTERCQAYQSGAGQDRASQSSDMHDRASQIRIERYRQHVESSDLNGAARAEKSGTNIGGATTGITNKYGVVWGVSGIVQRWAEVDIC